MLVTLLAMFITHCQVMVNITHCQAMVRSWPVSCLLEKVSSDHKFVLQNLVTKHVQSAKLKL